MLTMIGQCAWSPADAGVPVMSFGKLVATALVLGAASFAVPTLATNAAAPRQNLFIITDQEGYGTGECLERPGGCGKIIADSFCESKGFKLADYYRKAGADEVTGSIASEKKPPPREPSAYIIACK
jgi:hypothetical protein